MQPSYVYDHCLSFWNWSSGHPSLKPSDSFASLCVGEQELPLFSCPCFKTFNGSLRHRNVGSVRSISHNVMGWPGWFLEPTLCILPSALATTWCHLHQLLTHFQTQFKVLVLTLKAPNGLGTRMFEGPSSHQILSTHCTQHQSLYYASHHHQRNDGLGPETGFFFCGTKGTELPLHRGLVGEL